MIDIVKMGGSLLENRDLRLAALEAVATSWTSGKRSIVVHGGGKRIDKMLAALDIPKKVQGGLRVTDAETLDVVVSILSGLVNKTLVAELRARGIRVSGLSGADGDTLWAEFHEAVEGVDLGFVGRVVRCDPTLLSAVLAAGFLPLVASVALGREGTLLNVNADSAASALAAALGAKRLVFPHRRRRGEGRGRQCHREARRTCRACPSCLACRDRRDEAEAPLRHRGAGGRGHGGHHRGAVDAPVGPPRREGRNSPCRSLTRARRRSRSARPRTFSGRTPGRSSTPATGAGRASST
ncbi:MAG: acetylglutamate kinase [Holophagales bacterium]|nr:acetylglutamate kinase [Holophagales bacterium]